MEKENYIEKHHFLGAYFKVPIASTPRFFRNESKDILRYVCIEILEVWFACKFACQILRNFVVIGLFLCGRATLSACAYPRADRLVRYQCLPSRAEAEPSRAEPSRALPYDAHVVASVHVVGVAWGSAPSSIRPPLRSPPPRRLLPTSQRTAAASGKFLVT